MYAEGKNIEKSVKLMWQRVDKHICVESQLFEIVWKHLQVGEGSDLCSAIFDVECVLTYPL